MSQRKVINFLGVRFYAAWFSIITTLLAVFFLATKGLNFGLDFAGGTLVEVTYVQPIALSQIRATLEQGGYRAHHGSEPRHRARRDGASAENG